MPLPWVRLDSNIASNHKILALLAEKDGYRAAFAYVCALGFVGSHGTDGFIAQEALGFVHATKRHADLLVEYRLWIDQPGGWLINDWIAYQESTPETQERRKRAQAASQARWNGHEPMSPAERQRRYRERKRDAFGVTEDGKSASSASLERHNRVTNDEVSRKNLRSVTQETASSEHEERGPPSRSSTSEAYA